MLTEIAAIIGGFILLSWGADRFVTGASAIAWNLNISPLVIGLTVVSFGTSAPEIIVSAIAAYQGNAGLAVGNAIGSNIINTALILGLTAVIMPLSVHSSIVRRELPVLLIIMTVVLVLLFDGSLGRSDGIIMLAGVIVVLAWVTRIGLQRQVAGDPISEDFTEEVPTNLPMGKALVLLIGGLVVLLLSSRLLVWASVSVAQAFGVSDLVIGLTVVALGTSLPELAASISGALKNEHDLALGNIIGSNIFNLLAVLGLPGLIAPGPFDPMVLLRDYPVLFFLTIVLFIMAFSFRGRERRINRVEGSLLVVAFCAYQTLIYFSETTA